MIFEIFACVCSIVSVRRSSKLGILRFSSYGCSFWCFPKEWYWPENFTVIDLSSQDSRILVRKNISHDSLAGLTWFNASPVRRRRRWRVTTGNRQPIATGYAAEI